jgi:hypothetical protein
MAVTKRRNSGPEFFLEFVKYSASEFFNQKLKSASGRDFFSLYDAIRQFTKF